MKRCPDYPACGHFDRDCMAADANELAPDPTDGEGTYELHFGGGTGAVRTIDAPTRLDAVFTGSKAFDAERKAADPNARHVPVVTVRKVPPRPLTA